jgi:hypothetical protein
VQLITINARTAGSGGGATQSSVVLAGDGLLKTAIADIDIALIEGVPVTGDRGVLRQGKVGLGLLDLLSLVGALVDDRLQDELAMLFGAFEMEENLTFIRETSESAGVLPSCWWATRDSSLRMSWRVVWKVEEDIMV